MTKHTSASDADRLRMYMLMLVLMSFLQRITTSAVMFSHPEHEDDCIHTYEDRP